MDRVLADWRADVLQCAHNPGFLYIVGTNEDIEQRLKGCAILRAPATGNRVDNLRWHVIGICRHQQNGLVRRDEKLAKAEVA